MAARDVVSRKGRGAVRRLANAAYIGQAGSAGFKLRDVAAVRTYDLFHDLQRRYNLSVETVLYVGANHGQELPLLRLAFPRAVVHCFEPQTECQPALAAAAAEHPKRVRVHPVALSDKTGTAVLSRPRSHDQASSLLRPNADMAERFPHVRDWQEETVTTCTMDEWAADNPISDDIVIKLDVQGAEGMVMDGGAATFERARMVICELAVIPTYEHAPDLRIMLDRFLAMGFGYAGEVAQVRDDEAVVVEFDGAFVRPRSDGHRVGPM